MSVRSLSTPTFLSHPPPFGASTTHNQATFREGVRSAGGKRTAVSPTADGWRKRTAREGAMLLSDTAVVFTTCFSYVCHFVFPEVEIGVFPVTTD